jgi:7-keto-8-aminopelargonate synthetase-like enzyme
MDASNFRETVVRALHQGRERGHYFLRADDPSFTDRHLHIGGRPLLSFGSCSYLGLEFDPRLVEAATEAYRRYGSQTSYSRAFLSCPLYEELEEDLLPKIFGGFSTLVLATTSAAHHVIMPALLDDDDVAVVDHQVHRSVDDAVTLQCARSATKRVTLKHADLDQALDTVRQLARAHRHVWFFCDGIYSMYGDYLPADFMTGLLGVADNVRLYVDDAHGMSWAGENGRGHFLSRFRADERTVIATSLSKGFAGGGGAILATDRRVLDTARMVGGPYVFSGPLRPGDLGADIASAKIHLSADLARRQELLRCRVEQANALCRSLDVPLVADNETPIFFVPLGLAETAYDMAERLRERGFHVNVTGFPAVPSRRGGLRIAINAIHAEQDVDGLFRAIADEMPTVLRTAGISREELDAEFRGVLPTFARRAAA